MEAARATFAQIPLSSVNEEGGFFDTGIDRISVFCFFIANLDYDLK